MKPSGIGGQAVLEGIMMRNRDRYAVAVRKPDGSIAVDFHIDKVPEWRKKVNKIPIVRGVVSFVSSLVVGMRTLTYSASFFEEEEEEGKTGEKTEKSEKPEEPLVTEEEKGEAFTPFEMGMTVVLAIVLAVGIFILLPYGISLLFRKVITNVTLLSLLEGVFRLIIFLAYVWAISLMEDIKRTYMYHGSEHKCINCIENGLPLTVENVRTSSRFHKRCGTSFLLVVMVISILIFSLIRTPNAILRLVLRLLLIPVIAGISYEFLQWAGRSDNALVNILSKPGLQLQRLTTKEPDDDMIEVAITAVERVFDWQAFLDGKDPAECIPAPKKKKRSYRKTAERAAAKLKQAGIEEAEHDSRELLLYAAGLSLTDYLLVQQEEIPPETYEKYQNLVKQRAQHVPLQHLTGTAAFYGLDLKVNADVLVPRPETEFLVEQAIALCEEDMEILDLCTGSGCILISLLHELEGKGVHVSGTGSDLSEAALDTAQENAQNCNVRAQWILSDLFERIEGTYDLILSNPPYIRTAEIDKLQSEVRCFDPRMALDGGEDGLYFYRRIAVESGEHLKEGGHLFLEIGADQAQEVTALLTENGFDEIEIKTDLNGLDRVVHARRKEAENV